MWVRFSCVLIWGVGVFIGFRYTVQGKFESFDKYGMYSLDNRKYSMRKLDKYINAEFYQGSIAYHFLNPSCQCYKYSKNYVLELVKQSEQKGIKNIVILRSEDEFPANIQKIVLTEKEIQATRGFIPASPALLVYAGGFQDVAYLGPHTTGAVCGRGRGLLPLIINNLNAGFNPSFINTDVKGCFCKW